MKNKTLLIQNIKLTVRTHVVHNESPKANGLLKTLQSLFDVETTFQKSKILNTIIKSMYDKTNFNLFCRDFVE